MEQYNYQLNMGSLFAGIGGFEIGIETAMPFVNTIWQCEQDKYCQDILNHHWPNAPVYDDVRNITTDNAKPIDILCGGFPCQDISIAGAKKGIVKNETRSGLWWEMHRITSAFRPSIVFMENVSAIAIRGLDTVTSSLAQIGYVCEWQTLRASELGAPHQRERWFAVAYPVELYERTKQRMDTYTNCNKHSGRTKTQQRHPLRPIELATLLKNGQSLKTIQSIRLDHLSSSKTQTQTTYTNLLRPSKEHSTNTKPLEQTTITHCRDVQNCRIQSTNYSNGWQNFPTQSPVCRRDDGLSYQSHSSKRMDSTTINRKRLKALGNAIVPQCAQLIAQQVLLSGLIETIWEIKNETT